MAEFGGDPFPTALELEQAALLDSIFENCEAVDAEGRVRVEDILNVLRSLRSDDEDLPEEHLTVLRRQLGVADATTTGDAVIDRAAYTQAMKQHFLSRPARSRSSSSFSVFSEQDSSEAAVPVAVRPSRSDSNTSIVSTESENIFGFGGSSSQARHAASPRRNRAASSQELEGLGEWASTSDERSTLNITQLMNSVERLNEQQQELKMQNKTLQDGFHKMKRQRNELEHELARCQLNAETENDQLKKGLRELEHRCDAQARQAGDQQAEIQSLLSEKDDLEGKNQRLTQELATLQAAHQSTTATLESSAARMAVLEADSKELERLRASADSESLLADLNELQRAYNRLEASYAQDTKALRHTLDSMQGAHEKLSTDKVDLESALAQAQHTMVQLEQVNKRLEDELLELSAGRVSTSLDGSPTKDAMSDHGSQLSSTSLFAELSELQSEHPALGELEKLRAEVAAVEEAHAAELASFRLEVAHAQAAVQTSAQEAEQAQAALTAAATESTAEVAALASQLHAAEEAAKQRAAELEVKTQELVAASQAAEQARAELKSSAAALEAEKTTLGAQIAALKSEAAATDTKLQAGGEEVTELRAQLAAAQTEVELAGQSSSSQAASMAATFGAELEAAKQLAERTASELAAREQELSAARQAAHLAGSELTSATEQFGAERRKLQAQVDALHAEAEEKLAQAGREKSDLMKRRSLELQASESAATSESDATIRHLQDQLRTAKSTLAALETEYLVESGPKLKALEGKCRRLAAKVVALESQGGAAASTNEAPGATTAERDDLAAKLAAATAEAEQAASQAKSAEVARTTAEERVQSLEIDLRAKASALEGLRREMQRVSEEASRGGAESTERLSTTQRELADVRAAMLRLEGEVEGLGARNTSLLATVSEKESAVRTLQAQAANLVSRQEAAEGTQRKQLKGVTESVGNMMGQIQALQAKLGEREAELAVAKADGLRLVGERDGLAAELVAAVVEAERVASNLATQRSDLEAQAKSAEVARTTAEERVQSLEIDLRAKASALEGLRREMQRVSEEASRGGAESTERLSTTQRELADVRAAMLRLEGEVEGLGARNTSLLATVSEKESAVRTLQAQAANLVSRQEAAEGTQRKQLKGVTESVGNMMGQIQALQAKLGEREAELAAGSAQLAELRVDKARGEAELQRVRQRLDETEQQRAELSKARAAAATVAPPATSTLSASPRRQVEEGGSPARAVLEHKVVALQARFNEAVEKIRELATENAAVESRLERAHLQLGALRARQGKEEAAGMISPLSPQRAELAVELRRTVAALQAQLEESHDAHRTLAMEKRAVDTLLKQAQAAAKEHEAARQAIGAQLDESRAARRVLEERVKQAQAKSDAARRASSQPISPQAAGKEERELRRRLMELEAHHRDALASQKALEQEHTELRRRAADSAAGLGPVQAELAEARETVRILGAAASQHKQELVAAREHQQRAVALLVKARAESAAMARAHEVETKTWAARLAALEASRGMTGVFERAAGPGSPSQGKLKTADPSSTLADLVSELERHGRQLAASKSLEGLEGSSTAAKQRQAETSVADEPHIRVVARTQAALQSLAAQLEAERVEHAALRAYHEQLVTALQAALQESQAEGDAQELAHCDQTRALLAHIQQQQALLLKAKAMLQGLQRKQDTTREFERSLQELEANTQGIIDAFATLIQEHSAATAGEGAGATAGLDSAGELQRLRLRVRALQAQNIEASSENLRLHRQHEAGAPHDTSAAVDAAASLSANASLMSTVASFDGLDSALEDLKALLLDEDLKSGEGDSARRMVELLGAVEDQCESARQELAGVEHEARADHLDHLAHLTRQEAQMEMLRGQVRAAAAELECGLEEAGTGTDAGTDPPPARELALKAVQRILEITDPLRDVSGLEQAESAQYLLGLSKGLTSRNSVDLTALREKQILNEMWLQRLKTEARALRASPAIKFTKKLLGTACVAFMGSLVAGGTIANCNEHRWWLGGMLGEGFAPQEQFYF